MHSIENIPATLKVLRTLRTLQQALKTLLLDICQLPQSAKLKNLKNYPQLLHSLATQGLDFIFEALAVAALWYAEIFNVLNIYLYSVL